MLVYKRVNDAARGSASRRSRLRRFESETSNTQLVENLNLNHSNQTEITNDEKVFNDCDSNIQDSEIVVKEENNFVENATCDTKEVPQEPDSSMELESADDAAAIPVLDSQKNDVTKFPEDNRPNSEVCTSTIISKNPKIDYKTLNGAAHRAMSCGQRDFYEEVMRRFFIRISLYGFCEIIFSTISSMIYLFYFIFFQMEFERWEVSDTVRELVKQENVKHELGLLAVQQEKVEKLRFNK